MASEGWALAAVLALACASPAAGRTLFVDARSEGPSADGSASSPLRTAGAALAAARDGDVIELRPGFYRERLRIERRIALLGPRAAVLVGEDPTAPVVEIAAPASLSGLSIQGGAAGVEARADARLAGLWFSAQRLSPVRSKSARVEVEGGTFSALHDRPELFGIDAEGGDVRVRGTRFEGPFRFAIRARGARLTVVGARIEGAVGGIACLSGCEGEVRGSALAQGRGAGLFASGSRLRAVDDLLSHYEYCALARDGALLELEDDATAFCENAGVASVEARLAVRHLLHIGPARHAAIEVVGGSAWVEEGALIDPGPVGIASRVAEVEVRGTAISGAASDRDGAFGDGIFALDPRMLRVDGVLVAQSSGSGIAVQGGEAELRAPEIRGSGAAGVEGQRGARILVRGAHIGGGSGPAVGAVEGAQIRVEGGSLEGLGGAAWASCAEGASVRLARTRLATALAPCPCVTAD
jgi:hypothetical protein